jgi:hypothetical protein
MPVPSSSQPPQLAPVTDKAPSLTYALANAIERATERANDGQRAFGPVAALWEDYIESKAVRELPQRLHTPLIRLCKDFSLVATRHFDAYIKGSPPPRFADTPKLPANMPENAPPPPSQPRTFAQVATTDPASQPTTSRSRYLEKTKTKSTLRPDTRLFVRISPFHNARGVGAYAVLTALKKQLGDRAHLLKEVQAVKTGFALCTDSLDDLDSLYEHASEIEQKIGHCTVEKQTKWTTYRLDNIPRVIRTLIESQTVDSELLTDAITEATGQPPVRIVQTTQSVQNSLPNTCWFVSFDSESHTPLDKTLRILGVRAIALPIIYKPKIIQCTRCFQWHNARTCSRTERCCVCGSNSHTENSHTTQCMTAKPHSCPPRCLHCGGPHTADDRNCPLRPTHKGPKSKPERIAILAITKASHKRARAAAGCSHKATDVHMETESPTTPSTPTRARSPSIPASIPATRFRPGPSNRFAPLAGLTDRLQSARGGSLGRQGP